MKQFTILTAFLALFSTSLFSQVWDRFYPNDSIRLWKVIELNDGQLVSAGTTTPVNGIVNTVLMKLNHNGGWVKSVNIGRGFVYDLQFAGALFCIIDRRIVSYNANLNQIWATNASNEFINSIRPLSNGNLVTLSVNNTNTVTMHIINSQTGALVSRQTLINSDTLPVGRLPEFAVIKDNLYAIVNDAIWKFSTKTGRLIARLPFNPENLYDITASADQTLLVSKGEGTIYKVDTLGRQLWQRPIYHKSWSNTNGNGVLVVNEINSGRSSGELTFLDKNGNPQWFRAISDKNNELPFQARAGIQTSDGNFIVVGNTFLTNKLASRVVKMGNDNQLFLNRIVGTAYIDNNANCQKDLDDVPHANWIIAAKNKAGDIFWGLTDSLGQFAIRCDTGVLEVTPVEPIVKGQLWHTCIASSIRLSGIGKTDSVNLFHSFTNCAVLHTDISIGFLRPCQLSNIGVTYSNRGLATAQNAYLAVQLDPKLEFISATRPLSSRSGQFYKFNLGNIEPQQTSSFTINTRVRCGDTVQMNQTLCVKADIFSDTSCLNTAAWSGAELSVSGTCEQDSVVFVVKNIGRTASKSRNTVIIDNDTPQPISAIQLASQASTIRRFPANGHTWRLTVEQEPNHPTSVKATAFVEGCGFNTSPNITGRSFANNFAFDDSAPSVAVSCGVVRNSYDPNDKTGYPLGYGDRNSIDQNQDLTYKIRFQNTGNDTAYMVVIRDTIDTRFLDMSSIEFGASSHKYVPVLYDKNIVQFTFNNIMLPDSFRNEVASNGFVQFRIKQKKDLPIGTKIENSAGIYFDFNPPIITNLARHTVAKPIFNTVKTLEINDLKAQVEVSPNPFETETVFKIMGNTPLSIGGVFDLFDLNGRLLRHDFFDKNQYTLKRNDLNAGVYMYKIQNQNGHLASGKVVVF